MCIAVAEHGMIQLYNDQRDFSRFENASDRLLPVHNRRR
jgi:hypothetical protein